MQREQARAYRDQFEYLADCFELIRKRGDAYNIRHEALETERMVRYNERTGVLSERSHLLEIYQGIEEEATRLQARIGERKILSEREGNTFRVDHFARRHRLSDDELQVLLVLLYNESQGRDHSRFTTGHEILNLLFPNPVAALQASSILDQQGILLRAGLVQAMELGESTNFLRSSYEVTERTLQEVLGLGSRNELPDAEYSREMQGNWDRPFQVITPRVSLDQVVLDERQREVIDDVLWQVREGADLMQRWGVDRVLEKGRGTVLLLAGPPGTGKTMTGEALAHELGRPLHVADFAQMESKWIGETEKNIVACFRAAAAEGAVLLLDEADAILASRLDGGHYNDRAYNRQVSILLTELEAFAGLCVLTTNREVTLDEGLARRIAASLTLDIPGPEERKAIWRRLLPEGVPLAADVDLDALAYAFPVAGGHIKNAIVSAVRRAGRRGGKRARVNQSDFIAGARGERERFRRDARPIGFGKLPRDRSYG